jgi:hypothetical protein
MSLRSKGRSLNERSVVRPLMGFLFTGTIVPIVFGLKDWDMLIRILSS